MSTEDRIKQYKKRQRKAPKLEPDDLRIEPCPFCGNSSEFALGEQRVKCLTCNCDGPPKFPGRTPVERWNQRAS